MVIYGPQNTNLKFNETEENGIVLKYLRKRNSSEKTLREELGEYRTERYGRKSR